MDDRDRLALYPYVVGRIRCRVGSRAGTYRLARLAAKFGPEIGLRDLLDRFSYDCPWRGGAWQAWRFSLRRLPAGPRAASVARARATPGRSQQRLTAQNRS
jgi:hypothetical protein